ncbi:MAG: hypothetical protein ACRCY8_19900 [Dermatophilaceae bacterium]
MSGRAGVTGQAGVTGTPGTSGRAVAVLRGTLAVVGAAGVAYGILLLGRLDPGQVVDVARWVAGGIVVHDGLIAPLVVTFGALVAARAPGRLRMPLVRALVVLGPLTLVAVPVLGRFGAKPDNPTLLDRPYLTGYGVIVAGVLLLTALDAVRRSRRRSPAHRAARRGRADRHD